MEANLKFILFSFLLVLLIGNKSVISEEDVEEENTEKYVKTDNIPEITTSKTVVNEEKDIIFGKALNKYFNSDENLPEINSTKIANNSVINEEKDIIFDKALNKYFKSDDNLPEIISTKIDFVSEKRLTTETNVNIEDIDENKPTLKTVTIDSNVDIEEDIDEDIDDKKTIDGKHEIEKEDKGSEEDYEDYLEGEGESGSNEEQSCSLDYFIDRLTPDDYESRKNEPIVKDVKHINETIGRLNRFKNISSIAMEKMTPFFRQVGSRLTDVLFNIELEPECLSSIFTVMKALNNGELWAFRFLDSTGSPIPAGILDGVFTSFGEYDECLDIESPKSPSDQTIKGKYCFAKLIPALPPLGSFKEGDKRLNISIEVLNSIFEDKYVNNFIGAFLYYKRTAFRIGICFPSTCSHTDIENALNQVLYPKFQMPIEVGPECTVKGENPPLNPYQITSISVVAILSIIVIISTLFEFYFKRPKTEFDFKEKSQNNCLKDFLTSFSILKNTQNLFSETNNRFASIDTMRLIMTIWIFIQNTYLWTAMYGNLYLKRAITDGPYRLLTDLKYFPIRLPQLIDVLFLIRVSQTFYYHYRSISTVMGLNLSNIICGVILGLTFGSYKKFNYTTFVAKRWLRYTPPLIGSILFIYLTPLLGDGPLYYANDDFVKPCKENFLPTIFYYNNYNGDIENLCNIPSVYLSASFQLYLIAPIILIPLMKLKLRKAIIFNIICILIGCSICPLPKLIFGLNFPYEISKMTSFKEIQISLMQYWMGAHQHLSVLSYGILIGYLIKYKPDLNLGGKFGELLIWVFSVTCTVLGIFWNEQFTYYNNKTSHLHNILWFLFGRVVITTGFAWTLYACCTGRADIINKFMSIKIFRPFARLALSFYLLSNIVVAYRLLSVRESYILSDEHVFRGIATDFIITLGFAYILYILIESPINNLMKIGSNNEDSKPIDPQIETKVKFNINNGFNGSVDSLQKVITENKSNNYIK